MDKNNKVTEDGQKVITYIFDKDIPQETVKPEFSILELAKIYKDGYGLKRGSEEVPIKSNITAEELSRYVLKYEDEAIYEINVKNMQNGLRDGTCGILRKTGENGEYQIYPIDMKARQDKADVIIAQMREDHPKHVISDNNIEE